tara:strand:- start:8270 stop:9571 length:1302 start_codon:yes stop_codon:yes gene_type:complete
MENHGDIMNWTSYILLSALTISTQTFANPQTKINISQPTIQAEQQTETVSLVEANKTACLSHYQREQYKRALKTCRAAADLADADSQYILGQMFFNGHGVNPSYERAVSWFEKAAKQNHPAANLEMGKAFATGIVSPIHYPKSFTYFKKAAIKNNHEAQFLLALSYQNGFGVPMNYEQANIWFQKANLNGFPFDANISAPAQKNPEANSITPPTVSGEDIYLQAMRYNPWDPQQQAQKIQSLVQAANLNHPKAQYQLGLHYFRGQSVAQDDAKAYDYLIKSAAASYQPAQSLLAWMNALGLGVNVDLIQASNWFMQSNKEAYQSLFDKPTPQTISKAQGQKTKAKANTKNNFATIKKAAHQGSDVAQTQIGYLYSQGKGVPQNLVEAYAWLNLAAKSGSEQASAQRETVANKMTNAQITQAQNRSLALLESVK